MDNSWRSSLANDSRDKIVNRIVSHLQRHMPLIGQDAIDELPRIARRFEEKIFQVANNQTDYLRKISLKMLSFETMSGVRNATSTVDNMANTTDVGEIEEEPSVVNIEPVSTLPFVEVWGPDGRKKRFAEGTRAGFVVERFNRLAPNVTKPVVCIQAWKEGQEPIEFGPEVELILCDKSWTLQSVSEYAFSNP